MTLDWQPLRPEPVAEAAYDHLEAERFRHPARVLRWRPDRDPRSCTFDQFEAARPHGAPRRPPATCGRPRTGHTPWVTR